MYKDAMICRSCGNEERASEGYPCTDCGTFICIMCNFRGLTKCKSCRNEGRITPPKPRSNIEWPEH